MRCSATIAAILLPALLPLGVAGDPAPRRVLLETAEGEALHIATLTGPKGAYAVTLNDAVFTDHFLSMRPFRCIEGPAKTWCHVPYPYEIARDLTEDLVDLEYDFLFVWKGRTDYGIDMWNGVYYRLEEGAGGLVGTLHEMNMDDLAVPPEAGNLRPIREADLEPGDPDSHWLPVLRVEP